MQYNEFPSRQRELCEQERDASIGREVEAARSVIDAIWKDTPRTYQGRIRFGVGAIIGLIIGLIVSWDVSDIGEGLTIWLVFGAIGSAIQICLYKLVQSAEKATIANKEKEEESENNRLRHKIDKIKTDCEKKCDGYLRGFELEAQNASVKLAESKLAQEVIDWMSQGFLKAIDTSDRRRHVEKIEVPFVFCVYNNRITCNLGEYNFEINRCRNLESPVQQTALARAIASAVQFNVVIKYAKDPTGTDSIIHIKYEYYSDCPKVTMSYEAPNGNYESAEEW